MGKEIFDVRINIGSVFAIVFILICFYFLYQIIEILLVLVTSLIFATAISPGKRFLLRFKIPAPIAILLMYLVAGIIITFFIYSIIPVIAAQYNLFIESLPKIYVYFQELTSGTIFENIFVADEASFRNSIQQYLAGFTSSAFQGISTFFTSLVNFILFLIFTFLFAVKPDGIDNFFRIVSPPKYKPYISNLWSRTQRKMSQWFQGQLILMIFIGTITFLPLALLDIPNALFLAVFAGIMELIPLFGPFIAAIPAVLIALTLGDTGLVLIVIGVYVVIQFLENHLIHPLVVSKIVGIPPVSVILALVIGVQLAGFVGAVIAVPLTAAIQEFYRDLRDNRIQEIIEAHKN